MTDIVEQPTWGTVVPLLGDDWQTALPDAPSPYYVVTDEGWYKHIRTDAGRWVTRTYKKPPRLAKLGNTQGMGNFDGIRIPATIYAQAVDFFRRIFATHHTEAEVLITQHRTTKEYRLFVPTQRVSHGGVVSMYNPKHIDRDYLVVGTFHSHCDFSPNHSSIDEGDARDMDGIHGVIGYLTKDIPEMTLMVASNGILFPFKDVTDIVDTSDLTAATAPAWWDRFMVFGAPKEEDRPDWIDDDNWDKWMGRRKPKAPVGFQPQGHFSDVRPPSSGHQMDMASWFQDNDDYAFDPGSKTWRYIGGSRMTSESMLFNRQQANRPDPRWANDGALLPTGFKRDEDDLDEDAYWEAMLGPEFVESLMTSGLFGEDDLQMAIDMFPESGDPEFWIRDMALKLQWAVEWLNLQGMDLEVVDRQAVKAPAAPPALLQAP